VFKVNLDETCLGEAEAQYLYKKKGDIRFRASNGEGGGGRERLARGTNGRRE